MMFFLTKTENNVQVNLPSGKISKQGERTVLKPQKGISCTLYALRRIGIFNTAAGENTHLQAYKKIKKLLCEFDGSFDKPVTLITEILDSVGIDVPEAIRSNKRFIFTCIQIRKITRSAQSEMELFSYFESSAKWCILYDIFLEKVIEPLLNLQEASWSPHDGFEGLKKHLREEGALFFVGKFGGCFYSTLPGEYPSESMANRQVFCFEKKNYIGDKIPFTHGIIVDQVKVVGGKQMIFFRDPYYQSSPSTPEKIFMLSYETFLIRLCDNQGNRFSKNQCSDDATFGIASSCPDILYDSKDLSEPSSTSSETSPSPSVC